MTSDSLVSVDMWKDCFRLSRRWHDKSCFRWLANDNPPIPLASYGRDCSVRRHSHPTPVKRLGLILLRPRWWGIRRFPRCRGSTRVDALIFHFTAAYIGLPTAYNLLLRVEPHKDSGSRVTPHYAEGEKAHGGRLVTANHFITQ